MTDNERFVQSIFRQVKAISHIIELLETYRHGKRDGLIIGLWEFAQVPEDCL